MSTKTLSRGAVDRLEAVLAAAERNPSDTSAWRSYVTGLDGDARELASAGLKATLAIGRMRDLGQGWGRRADLIEQVMREARKARDPDPGALRLDVDTDGRPRRTPSNAERVLMHDPAFDGAFRLNLLSDRVEWNGIPLTDEHVTEIGIQIDRQYQLVLDEKPLGRVIRLVSKAHAYHPVRDYLNGLEWDGVQRLATLLGDYFHAEPPEGERAVLGVSPLLEALGRRWMVSAVARAMQPGCKVDTVLILQGAQGQRKSSAFEALGGAWFRNTKLEIDSKDVYQQVAGVWIYEIQEIDGMLTRKHAADLKSFVSSKVDSYRRPYAEHLHDQPRSMVFAGTTNQKKILLDPTGSRRFWPVSIREGAVVEYDRLVADRDQLWAEAVELYRMGVPWHLTADEDAALDGASEEYRTTDLWEEHVARILEDDPEMRAGGFTTTDMLHKMQIPIERQGDVTTERIQRILQAAGYRTQRVRRGDLRPYVWKQTG